MSTPRRLRRRRSKFINEQRHKAACGPIAIANAIKWLGVETSYRKVLDFCIEVRAYHRHIGMYSYQMRYVLRTLQVPFKVRRKMTVEGLDKIIDGGGAVILAYQSQTKAKDGTISEGGHVVFINGRSVDGYLSWNKTKGLPPWFEREAMRKALARSEAHETGLYVYVFPPHTPVEKDTVPKDSST